MHGSEAGDMIQVLGYRCMAGGCRRVMQVSDKVEAEPTNPLSALTFAKSPSPHHTHRSGGPCQKLAKGLSVHKLKD